MDAIASFCNIQQVTINQSYDLQCIKELSHHLAFHLLGEEIKITKYYLGARFVGPHFGMRQAF